VEVNSDSDTLTRTDLPLHSKAGGGYLHQIEKQLEELEQLEKDSSVTIEYAKKVGEFLIGAERKVIPTLVNIHTIKLGLPKEIPTNSNMLVWGKGEGKGTFLINILQESNPEVIIKRDDKHFESQLVELPKDEFIDKVWVVEDVITTFEGMSRKQRMQLIDFYTIILSNKRYSRGGFPIIKDVNISCQFGLAKQEWYRFRGDLFTSTFEERVLPTYDQMSLEEIEYVLKDKKQTSLPSIKLDKLYEEKKEIEIPSLYDFELVKLALILSKDIGLSTFRVLHYIKNFIKANALINERPVCKGDIELFQFILSLHYSAQAGSLKFKILNVIADAQYPITPGEIAKELDVHIRMVQLELKELRIARQVKYERGSHGVYIYSKA
jgi:hypothetical protein